MLPQDRPPHRNLQIACAVLAGMALPSCMGIGPSRVFAPVADHARTEPRSLGERGFAPTLSPPPSVGWELTVLALDGDERTARYEMRCTFRDDSVGGGHADRWRIEPTFSGAEIVDDEGRRFPCVRARVPVEEDPDARDDGEASRTRSFSWVFEVSGSYDFRRVQFVAVHWGFQIDGQPIEITSRFRVA